MTSRHWPLLALVVCAAAGGAARGGAATPTPTPTPTLTPIAPEPAASAASASPTPQRVLISGHSLVDQPLPDQLAAIAQSLGTPFAWNRQYVVGSSIRERTAGHPAAGPWNGYRGGANREGQNLDLLRELRTAGASPEPYDTLLITEQHGLLGTLVWNDTVRHLRHFHDRFIEANAKGQTWFYESWLGIDDKGDPRRWIAYEREASKVWQCVATRVNVSLEAEGRSDRIASLPAGQALAHLVSQATTGSGVPGISSGERQDTRTTVNRLVRDDVHLMPLGSYYLALVSYVAMFDRSPIGALTPAGISAEQAASLQRVAAEFMASYRSSNRALSLAECRSLLQRSFIGDYWGYWRDTTWRREQGTFSAYLRWAWTRAKWHWRFSRDNADNPFHFDPTTDKTYWLPKPE